MQQKHQKQQRLSLSRPLTTSSSLPSLRHWADSPCAAEPPSPYVAPHCPHEHLSQASRAQSRLGSAVSRKGLMSRASQGSDWSSLQGGFSDFLDFDDMDSLWEEDGIAELPDEPMVDEYLEQIYPTSPATSPRRGAFMHLSVALEDDFELDEFSMAPATPKTPATGRKRLGSAMSVRSTRSRSSTRGSLGGGKGSSHPKGYRQRVLEQFGTARKAFDEFVAELQSKALFRHDAQSVEFALSEDMFEDFLAKHFAEIPEEERQGIFNFFDLDGSGTIEVDEFYHVVEAMSPVRSLMDLRKRWIALAYPSCLKAMEQMAPRITWATKCYSPDELGDLLCKVGVFEEEEHLYIFGAIAGPLLKDTISISELLAGLASVSPVLLMEDWRYRLSLLYDDFEKAYDKIELIPGALTDINKFVVKAGEFWKMNREEARRFFRLCDFDKRDKLSRQKFLVMMEICEPTLLHEVMRSKLRHHFRPLLEKLRKKAGDKVSMESFAPQIYELFTKSPVEFKEKRAGVPDDYQRTFDQLEITAKDIEMVFGLLDFRRSGKTTPEQFWHALKAYSPFFYLHDLVGISSRAAQKTATARQEAMNMPAWQARQMGLVRTMQPELAAWWKAFQEARSIKESGVAGAQAEFASLQREAAILAGAAVVSITRPTEDLSQSLLRASSGGGSPIVRQVSNDLASSQKDEFWRTRHTEATLQNILQTAFPEGIEVKAQCVMDLIEEPLHIDGRTSAPSFGVSLGEFAAACGATAADIESTMTSQEGREAKAQLEARWQLAPFSDFAAHLREGVREKVKPEEQPRAMTMGSSYEPASYVSISSLPRVAEADEAEDGRSEVKETPHQKSDLEKKLVPLLLVQNDELRSSIYQDVMAEEASKPLPYIHRSKNKIHISGPGETEFLSMYKHLKDDTPSTYIPDDGMVHHLQGYFSDMGSLVENDKVLFASKPKRKGPQKRP